MRSARRGGAAITTPFIAAAKTFSDVGDAFAKTAVRTGVAVESISELAFAAEQSGTSLETLEGALRKMSKNLVDAASGSESAQEAFKALGLSAGQLIGIAPEKQFKIIADRLAKIKNPTLRAAAAMDIFGKSGTQLLPLVADGAKGIEDLQKQAHNLGLTMGGDDAKAAELWNDTLNILSKSLRANALTIGAAIVPTLVELATQFVRIITSVNAFIDANRPLIVTVFKIGVGIAAAGAAITALGGVVAGAGAILGGLSAAIGAVGTVLGLLLSPLALVVAGIAGATFAFFKFTDAGQQTLGWLGDRFGEFKSIAVETFGGIADALAAGDIQLAANILWLGLKSAWLQGVAALSKPWLDFKFFMASTLIELGASLQTTWVNITSDLTGSWGEMVKRLIDLFIPLGSAIAAVLGVDVKKSIDDLLAGAGIDQGGAAGEASRQAARDAKLSAIDQDRQQAQAALTDQKGADTGVADALAELEKARAELKARVDEAKSKREAVTPLDVTRKDSSIADFTPENLDKAVKDATAKVDVGGSFSATALRGLGAGDSVANDQLKEQKEANKKLDKIDDRLRRAEGLAIT